MKLIETQIQTIPSYEVAEMMGKRHGDVLRMLEGSEKPKVVGIIPVIEDSVELRLPNYYIKSTYKTSQNKEMPYYECTKMGCDMLANKMTGEKGILFTAKYVKKFEEMKVEIARDSYMIQDPIQRALAWAEEEKVREQQQKQLEQQKPLVDAYKQFLDVGDNMDFETLGKHLGIGRNTLTKQLREWKVLQDGVMNYQGQRWKNDKHNIPYQKYMDKGFFVLKQVKIPNGQFKTKTLVTPRGATAIAKELAKQGVI